MQVVEAPLAGLAGMSCRDFARLTVARLDRPLRADEKIRHRLHGALCGLCGKFAAQFAALNDLTDSIEAEARPPSTDEAAVHRVAAAVRASVQRQND
jgi:hypothetical protein